jgi:hypothetical protein
MRGPSICENDVKDMNVGDCFGGKEDEPSELKLGGAKQPSRRATGGRREKGARVEVEWRRRWNGDGEIYLPGTSYLG